MIRVRYIQRRSRPGASFSLELVFAQVRASLGPEFESQLFTVPYYSNGLLPRLANGLAARQWRKEICHVTGDINYVAILLDPRRTVFTNADCGFIERTKGIKRSLLKYFWLKLPIRRSRFVTTISQAAKSELLKYVSVDPDKIRVIHCPVAEQFQRCEPNRFPERPRILQIGTAFNKNLNRTFEALAGIPCQLVVVGKLSQEQLGLLHKLGIQYENVVGASSQEMVRQYQLADIVVFPSLLEGFGMPIIEANAVGRPVLTSNLSSMPEVAGDAACLVDPLEVSSIRAGLQQLIDSPDYRKELVERGFRNVQRFSPRGITAQYEELYRIIADENSLHFS